MQIGKTNHQKFWTHPLIVLLGTFMLFIYPQAISAFISAPINTLITSETQRLAVFVGLNVLVLFVLLKTIFAISGYSWRSIGYTKPSLKSVLSVLPAFAIYFVISTILTLLAIRFLPGFKPDQVQDIGFKDLENLPSMIAGFISLVVLTPIFEETIFRGVLFKGLRKRLPFWFAALVSSAAFAVAHLQWNVSLDTFALGLILCVLVERSKSIIPSILLHAAKNSVAFIFLFLLK